MGICVGDGNITSSPAPASRLRRDRAFFRSGRNIGRQPPLIRQIAPAQQEEIMQIAEVMTRSVDLADPNMKLQTAAKRMREDDVGALPVGENDRLIGMVTDRDIVMRGIAAGQALGNTSVRDVMSEKICYCYEDQSLDEVARIMAKHQVHRLPVLNRDKRLVGIVALADLARNGTDGEKAALAALRGISEETGEPRRMGGDGASPG